AVLVPFNPKYRAHEMTSILQNSGAQLLFVCEEFAHVEREAIQSLVKEIVTVRYREPSCHSFERLLAETAQAGLPAVSQHASETFCILYTSGTTGTPKGALISHHALVQSGIAIGDSMRCTEHDVFLVLAPIF